MCKKNYPEHLQSWAIRGDKILKVKIDNLTYMLPKRQRELVRIYLNSNKFLSTIKPLFTIRTLTAHQPIGYYTNPGKYGDMVEATIYFIKLNYGDVMLDRFLYKHIKKAIDSKHYLKL
jgi:hypothetical protein